MKPATARGLVVLGVVLGVGAYMLWDDWRLLSQVWEGTVTEAWKEKPFLPRGSSRSRNRYKPDYFWRVKRTDGSNIAVEVPGYMWEKAPVGTRIFKRKGNHYPEMPSGR